MRFFTVNASEWMIVSCPSFSACLTKKRYRAYSGNIGQTDCLTANAMARGIPASIVWCLYNKNHPANKNAYINISDRPSSVYPIITGVNTQREKKKKPPTQALSTHN